MAAYPRLYAFTVFRLTEFQYEQGTASLLSFLYREGRPPLRGPGEQDERAVTIANVPRRPLRVNRLWSFLQGIMAGQATVFRPAPAGAPAAYHVPGRLGRIQCRPVHARLAARYDLFEHTDDG